jgi:hypothetical protein
MTAIEALRAGRLREPEKLASFVLGTCRMTVLDLRRGARRRARLLAVDDAGTERLLGEFTFRHTRTLPGPGAW